MQLREIAIEGLQVAALDIDVAVPEDDSAEAVPFGLEEKFAIRRQPLRESGQHGFNGCLDRGRHDWDSYSKDSPTSSAPSRFASHDLQDRARYKRRVRFGCKEYVRGGNFLGLSRSSHRVLLPKLCHPGRRHARI